MRRRVPFRSSNAHIHLRDQSLRLIDVFELWVVLLVLFFSETLQQVLSVSRFFVKLRGHNRADELHRPEGTGCVSRAYFVAPSSHLVILVHVFQVVFLTDEQVQVFLPVGVNSLRVSLPSKQKKHTQNIISSF